MIISRRHVSYLSRIAFALSIVSVAATLYDLGFQQNLLESFALEGFHLLALCAICGSLAIKISYHHFVRHIQLRKAEYFLLIFLLLILFWALVDIYIGYQIGGWNEIIHRQVMLNVGVVVYLLIELSRRLRGLYRKSLNPALIFVVSFMLIIFIGSLLLMLPVATTNGIALVDAIFTAASAVSVTGLAVVDTGKAFTLFGQLVIIILIQIGGLGMLTFTSFFAYFFQGGASFQESLFVKDFISANRIGGVFRVVIKIIGVTLFVEFAGAIFIYFSLDHSVQNPWFFSFFHAVSAYCNAGFSTLGNGLYDPAFRFNYAIHLTVAALLIIGGLGFNLIFNFYTILRQWLYNLYMNLFFRKKYHLTHWIFTLDSRLSFFTTLVLIAAGSLFFLMSEWDNALVEHPTLWGKCVTAFFGGVTPRTAGFNTVDMSTLTTSTLLFYFFLMWVGASPGSTGGGIKTTTFAISFFNILQTATGKPYLEIGHREIALDTIRRAFAIIMLSFAVITVTIFLLAMFDQKLPLLPIAFESISAFSTVGLSMGITPSLSTGSKWVLICTMLIGRVGMLNLLTGMLRQIHSQSYRYPKENVLIN